MRLRDFVLYNFWIKLLSVVLAIVIWLAIHGLQNDMYVSESPFSQIGRKEYQIMVGVMTQPGDARVFKVTPEKVLVTMTGENALLQSLTPRDFRAYVDLSLVRGDSPTSQIVRLHTVGNVTTLNILPAAVMVEQISP